VVAGYIKLLDPRVGGDRFIRLILGRGGLFGDRPFGAGAFCGFISPQREQAVAHGPAEVIEMDRRALEAAAHAQAGLATLLASARSSEKDCSAVTLIEIGPLQEGASTRVSHL
jgi:hypothetical protein